MPAAEEALLKRVLPHSIEAEQSVIGAMIMDREAITVTSEIISGDDFYSASSAAGMLTLLVTVSNLLLFTAW